MESFALHLYSPTLFLNLRHNHGHPRPSLNSLICLHHHHHRQLQRQWPFLHHTLVSLSLHRDSRSSRSKFNIQLVSDNPAPTESESVSPPPLQGAKPIPLIILLVMCIAVCFFIPRSPEVTPQAWQLLSIFLSTITGLVFSPLSVGIWVFLGLIVALVTKTLIFTTSFTNEVIWLIVISFFFAWGFVKIGLGDRIATYFVKWLGKSTLGLSYGLTLSEALIAPAMPSTTAQAGGVFLPTAWKV